MKALNQAERNNLYLKFLLLFTITVSITVFAIFFDYQLPAKLNDEQRQKLKAFNGFNSQQKKIVLMIDTLNTQIMNLGNSSKDWSILKMQILEQIKFKQLSNDTSGSNLLAELDKTYYNFLEAKSNELDAKDKLDKFKKNTSDLEKLNQEKEEILKLKADSNTPE